MTERKAGFWTEAMKAGSVIGIVAVAFALLAYAVQGAATSFWTTLTAWLDFAVFVGLIYAFSRRMCRMADPQAGFSYGRSVGFVFASMIFAGIILGVYTTVMNNFVAPELVTEQLDRVMAAYQDMLPADQFDGFYSMTRRMMFNPIMLVLSSVFGLCIKGGLVGLMTSIFTRREADPFAGGGTAEE